MKGEFFYFLFFFEHRGHALTAACRKELERWMFRDGESVNDELKDIGLDEIRAACAEQSRSGWTSIASRNRLYQFIALSDEVTQREMREKMSMTIDNDRGGVTTNMASPSGASPSTIDSLVDGGGHMMIQAPCSEPRGAKRQEVSHPQGYPDSSVNSPENDPLMTLLFFLMDKKCMKLSYKSQSQPSSQFAWSIFRS